MQTKRLIAAILALVLVLAGACAVTVSAADESYEYSQTVYTATGNHTVTLLDSVDITVYGFKPDEEGVYKITTSTAGTTLYTFTGSEFFLVNGGAAEGNTVTLEVKSSYVGNTFLFGVKGGTTATVRIALSDEAITIDPSDLPWDVYENKATLSKFDLADDISLEYVDISNAHSAVLGSDGFYHLDGAEGPVLYINVGTSAPYIRLYDAVGYGQVRCYFFDEDGNFVKKVSFNEAVTEYYNNSDRGIYPLTEDLIYIYQTYGESNKWYDEGTPTCIFPGSFVKDSAWMFACCFEEGTALEPSEPDVSYDPVDEFILGDTNRDGKITSLDAAAVLKHDAMIKELDDEELRRADVNGDGNVNSLDAAQILKYDAFIIDKFPASPAVSVLSVKAVTQYALGDVNKDGKINSLDAAAVLKYDALMLDFDAATLDLANVNGDVAVNSLDAAQILKYDALIIDSFGSTADDEPEYGTQDAPYPVFTDDEFIVKPGETVYITVTYKNGMNMTVTAGDFSEEIAITDLNQAYSFTNTDDETVILNLTFAAPKGHMSNPIELTTGKNTVTVEAGSDGVHYTWTAPADGQLTVKMPGGNWFYCINNITASAYGDNQWSDSDPVVANASLVVSAGDEIHLVFNTYNPSKPWTAPAGELEVNVSFTAK